MMADHQLTTCDDGQREVWTNVRKLALDALAHTRKAILTLESNRPAAGQNDGTNQDDHEWRTLQQQANDMSTESSGLSELDELITVCRGNLAANGCAGEVLRLGVELRQSMARLHRLSSVSPANCSATSPNMPGHMPAIPC